MSQDQHGDPGGRGEASSSDTGSVTDQDALAEQLRELALTLQDQDDVGATLHEILRAAVDTIPGAEQASISSVVARREVHTRAATADLPRAIDRAQYETGQGPCLDTLYEQATVRLPDMAHEDRWPEFAARAHELGAGSMLSLQLYVTSGDLGAMNLSSTRVGAFTDESEHVGLLFATHAAVALAGAESIGQLREGLATRDMIGQAKGILMERHKITGDQAFRLLVRVSQDSNRKLRDIAEELSTTGELPVARSPGAGAAAPGQTTPDVAPGGSRAS